MLPQTKPSLESSTGIFCKSGEARNLRGLFGEKHNLAVSLVLHDALYKYEAGSACKSDNSAGKKWLH